MRGYDLDSSIIPNGIPVDLFDEDFQTRYSNIEFNLEIAEEEGALSSEVPSDPVSLQSTSQRCG